MRFDNLAQFLVPLTFLAIWAITSLFNREAQPLPPRRVGGGGPDGPRGGPESRSASRGISPTASAIRPTSRPEGDRSSSGPRMTEERGSNDGIVILDDGTRRPRKEGRNRGSSRASGPGRSSASETPRPGLTVDMHRPTAVPLHEMRGLVPLTTTALPLANAGGVANVLPSEESGSPSRSVELMSTGGERVRALTSDTQRLRDAFILAEVLFQRPTSRRAVGTRRPTPPPALS